MTLRPTQSFLFSMVQRQLASSMSRVVRAQEQIASGKRILRPADDPVASSQILSFRRQVAGNERFLGAVQAGRTALDAGSVALQDASGILAEARELLIEGMNGSKSPDDRELLADQIDLIRARMLDLANLRSGDRFLFAGTRTQEKPFESRRIDGRDSVVYLGNHDEQRILAGSEFRAGIGLPGSEIFAKLEHSGTRYAGLTGATSGSTADDGAGYDYLLVRHETTGGVPGAGVQLVGGGAGDTIMGDHTLTIDGVAGTVQLDGGPAVAIPAPGAANLADLVVRNEHGAELHLDFTGYAGGSSTATLRGEGSVSIDGSSFTALTFAESDLELIDPVTGSVIHVDTTGIHRSGSDLVSFGGTVNIFDVLEGIASDLRNGDALEQGSLVDRLDTRLREFDRNAENVRIALGNLGSRSSRLQGLEARLEDANLQVQSMMSRLEDVDYGQAVFEMSRAQTSLEIAQATGVRLLQTTLANFL